MKGTLRVAFLLERFPVLSETFVATQMRGLRHAGHEVDVVSQHRPRAGEPVHEEVAGSALLDRTHYVDAALTPDRLDAVPSVPLAPDRHDVLHAHFGPNARRFAFAKAQADAPFVVTFHGYDYSAQPRAHGAAMYDVLFETADVVTFNCEQARLALERLGCPPRKLARLRMPVVVDEFAFRARRLRPGEPVRVLTVGRLVEKKGHGVALQAIADVARDVPVRYDIVGGGPLAERLETLVRELGLGGIVGLHGARDSAYVRALLDRAHLFVLASAEAADGDREGTPLALMEAQACGLPVVSTIHAGIPEVVLDGRTGLLVPENEPQALARAIRELIQDPGSWPALGECGRAHVRRVFDTAPCTTELLDVYARAASVCDGARVRRREPGGVTRF
jgi:colanic acid/amylovoran/stewartan biosynthesis glycosyltransferase WcaL/AmsK/CpsK